MSQFAKEINGISLEQEMRQSYLDYAMSVIVGRALPDVRDGLKPVHRRALYAMDSNNNAWNRPYIKSARIVGEVIGKYHPHGDTAVYDTIVRMAQPFSMREMLVDGQGNFGSIDGDSAAAMRYTEIRMSKIAHQMLRDIEKETVNFAPNYDDKEVEPTVLPTRFPNLLVNGSSGIAVGMATNIPPHNVSEVIDACLMLIQNPNATIEEIMTVLPGPDFPTSALINGTAGIKQAYETGRGSIQMRAKTHIETDESTGKQSIIVDELPYQVNKAVLVKRIADLYKDKEIDGISDIRDESDKDGIRMAIELRRGEVPEVTLNNLFRKTTLQTSFGMNMVALLDGRPQLLSLNQVLHAFLKHRREVVTRRTIFDLRKARQRAHTIEGLAIALSNIDEIIELIKKAVGPAEAKDSLLARTWLPGQVLKMLERAGPDNSRPDGLSESYGMDMAGTEPMYCLSPAQAQAILDLRLHRLTGLEQDKIYEEYQAVIATIEDLLDILQNPDRLVNVVTEELAEVKESFNEPRRSEILAKQIDLTLEDLIVQENLVVTWSHQGYVKSQPLSDYEAQRRGGRGKSATATKDDDFVERLFIANTHDTLLAFSSMGKVYWMKVYELPQAGRNAKGKPIVNLLPLDEGEKINAVLPIKEYDDEHFIFFATKRGVVKKTPLSAFKNQRSGGIIAVGLRENDELINVRMTDGTYDIMLFSNIGKVVRFHEQGIRSMGRTAAGVRGIRLKEESEHVVALISIRPEDDVDILTATVEGYGKRTKLSEYPSRSRGTQGVISIKTSERNGEVIGAIQVMEDDEVMLITNGGTLIRTRANEVSRVSRNTQGVRLIKTGKGEKLINVTRIIPEDEDAIEVSENGDQVKIVSTDAPVDTSNEAENLSLEDSEINNNEDIIEVTDTSLEDSEVDNDDV